jgi:hypothetical protein
MIRETLTADTQHEVIALKDLYFRKYDPAGYGTSATEPKIVNDKWSITVSRFNSCD